MRVLEIEAAENAAFVGELARAGGIGLEEIDRLDAQRLGATAAAIDPAAAWKLHLPPERLAAHLAAHGAVSEPALGNDETTRVGRVRSLFSRASRRE